MRYGGNGVKALLDGAEIYRTPVISEETCPDYVAGPGKACVEPLSTVLYLK